LNGLWVPHDTRDTIVEYVRRWSGCTDIPAKRFVAWLGIAEGKFYDWRNRFGKVNEHNAWIPRDWWLTGAEKVAIVQFAHDHPLEGYRRLTFMMLDADVVAVSPASVYRVLKQAGLMDAHNTKPSLKGTGFQQPLRPHEHWHVDISYLNIAGTFYYLCSLLDGCSRFIVHWEIRETMTEADVQTIIQRARELHPGATPRIISDNGPQFIAKDFKEFIRTRLIVSHKVASVRSADLIVVLQQGRITEQGTHAALMARGGSYAQTFAMQTRALEV
jgi:hypothetical protein